MSASQQEDHQEEIQPVSSFSERRKIREQQNVKGTNIYGGELCVCDRCGDTHWRAREETKG